MKLIVLYALITVALSGNMVSAQNRAVIQTNRQGQIVRLTINPDRRIVRREVVGNVQGFQGQQGQQGQRAVRREAFGAGQQQQDNRAGRAGNGQQRQLEAEEQRRLRMARQQPPPEIPELPAEEPQQPEPQDIRGEAYHMVGISTDFLMRNGRGFTGFTVQTDPSNDNTIYAGNLPVWGGERVHVGVSAGLNYAYVSSKYVAFLLQSQVDLSGWAFGALNIGLGLKFPVHPAMTLSIDSYFGIALTGVVLPSLTGITLPEGSPQSITAILTLFGFKTRIAFEFPLPRNMYVSVALSYAAYPWAVTSTRGNFFLNHDSPLGNVLAGDAFKVGIEFGWKIPVKKRPPPLQEDQQYY